MPSALLHAYDSSNIVFSDSDSSLEHDIHSLYTVTSSSTVPGLGALAGKAIKAMGKFTIRTLDSIVIRRTLSVLNSHFPDSTDKPGYASSDPLLYDQLLELSRSVPQHD